MADEYYDEEDEMENPLATSEIEISIGNEIDGHQLIVTVSPYTGNSLFYLADVIQQLEIMVNEFLEEWVDVENLNGDKNFQISHKMWDTRHLGPGDVRF